TGLTRIRSRSSLSTTVGATPEAGKRGPDEFGLGNGPFGGGSKESRMSPFTERRNNLTRGSIGDGSEAPATSRGWPRLPSHLGRTQAAVSDRCGLPPEAPGV